jgi:FAD synthase
MQIGTYYQSTVLVGTQTATLLGVPTANILAPDALLLFQPGVYAGHCVVVNDKVAKNESYDCCVFLSSTGVIETHCLDQTNLTLYNKTIKVSFVNKIRDIFDFFKLDSRTNYWST